ncbi:MAG: thioesterase family protein [Gammaproteobacteria bacterium]|nr:thioesterase family protein [Gammaproteobacteria bacterium]
MARTATGKRPRSSGATRPRTAVIRPQVTHAGAVQPEWIDYNGHMNLAYYVLLFDFATDTFLDRLGLTPAFRSRHHASTFAAEIHVNYLRELCAGDPVRITTQLLDHDERRIHYFHRMYHRSHGFLAATNELLSLYVDMRSRHVVPMPALIRRRLAAMGRPDGRLPRPEQAGRVIRIRRG